MNLSYEYILIHKFTSVLDLLGVLVSGIIAGKAGIKANFDITGCTALSIIGALGGGIIRDTILQQGIPIAFKSWWYIPVAMSGGLLAYCVRSTRKVWDRIYPHIDALSLGVWAVVGAEKALLANIQWLQAILLGVITAVGGGVLRDIILQKMPQVFVGGNALYFVPTILASGMFVITVKLIPQVWSMLLGTVLAILCTGIIVPLAPNYSLRDGIQLFTMDVSLL